MHVIFKLLNFVQTSFKEAKSFFNESRPYASEKTV